MKKITVSQDKSINVLIVDDEKEACKILDIFLTKSGFETDAAFNGVEALKRFKEKNYALVLLDVRMPGMDGIEVLKRIRRENSDCVVIMLTAVDDVDTALMTIKEGANDFLRKPVELHELKHSVESQLEKRALKLENRFYQTRLEDKVEEQTKSLSELNAYLKRTNLEIVRALAEAIEAKDPYVKGHCSRVTGLSLKLGKASNLDAQKMETLEYGALLHDIGKIGIRGSVLNKAGPLSAEEFEHVKTHPVIGERIISHIDFLKDAMFIVKHHHERMDGQGYPDKLPNEKQNMLSKIVLVADAYDAMTSDRPYRKALREQKAVEILKENCGTQFDGDLVNLFVSNELYK